MLRVTRTYTSTIRVGGYGRRRGVGSPNYRGPDLGSDWAHDRTGYFQELETENIVDLEYQSGDGTIVNIYRVRHSDSALVENSLNLVPESHLEWLNRHKPEGFIVADSAGRGGAARYTGGLNAMYDDSTTSDFNERNGIIITYGAFFRYKDVGVSPTMLHEIGHVMTKRGRINYQHFTEGRRERLMGTRVSRNPGAMEALCNAYMYFLCYASNSTRIRSFGDGGDELRDSVTRSGLRPCPAFSNMLTVQEQARFAERQ